jgi:hypothetical protein
MKIYEIFEDATTVRIISDCYHGGIFPSSQAN